MQSQQLLRWRQEDQEFKVTLGKIENAGVAWVTRAYLKVGMVGQGWRKVKRKGRKRKEVGEKE